jgi:DNA-binding response OmpR family regulator
MSRKVLVVDDEQDIVDFMERFLIRKGISVVKASNGELAVEICKKEMPDCVFLDIQMSGKDGISTLIELKKLNPALKVIMITGKDNVDLKEKAARAGAMDYITKPLDLSELHRKIQTYILNT